MVLTWVREHWGSGGARRGGVVAAAEEGRAVGVMGPGGARGVVWVLERGVPGVRGVREVRWGWWAARARRWAAGGGAGLGPEIWRFRGGVVVCGVGGGHRVAEEEGGGVERGGGGVEGCSGGGGANGLDVGDLVGGGRGPVSYLRQSLVQLPGYANIFLPE